MLILEDRAICRQPGPVDRQLRDILHKTNLYIGKYLHVCMYIIYLHLCLAEYDSDYQNIQQIKNSF